MRVVKKNHMHVKTVILKSLATCIIGSWLLGFPSPTLAAENYEMRVSLNQQETPTLYYRDLTLTLDPLAADSFEYSTDGGASWAAVGTSWDGTPIITTNATTLLVRAYGVSDVSLLPGASIAPLRDAKIWAWSHGFDDNASLWDYEESRGDPLSGSDEDDRTEDDIIDGVSKDDDNPIGLFIEQGYQGSVYLIGEFIDSHEHDIKFPGELRDVSTYIDEIDILRLIELGWGIGNHHYGKNCTATYGSLNTGQSIVYATNNIFDPIIARSLNPEYKSIGFAAPNFDDACDAFISYMTANSTILFNEDGNGSGVHQGPVMVIDDTFFSTFTTSNPYGEYGYYSEKVFRHSKGYDPAIVIDTFDMASTMAHNAEGNSAYWYNTLTHGNSGDEILPSLNHFDHTYGYNGSQEAWMAPSDEIYSYLVMRDATTLQLSEPYAIGNPPPEPTPTDVPTPKDFSDYLALIAAFRLGDGTVDIFDFGQLIHDIVQQ